jgi:hypothetical protein
MHGSRQLDWAVWHPLEEVGTVLPAMSRRVDKFPHTSACFRGSSVARHLRERDSAAAAWTDGLLFQARRAPRRPSRRRSQSCRMYMANRIPTIVLVTLALLVAVPIAARSRNTHTPALESSRSTVTAVLRTGSRHASDVSDEAAMALLGTALVAAGAALRKAA